MADVEQSENPEIAGSYTMAAAQLARAEGRGEEAFAMVQRIFEAQERSDWVPSWLRFDAFEAVILVSEPERIRALLAVLADASHLRTSVLAQRARFRARLPEHDAETEFETAERLFRELEAPFYLAATQLEHAEYLLVQDRAEEAAPLLVDARETFERLRAKPWLDRLDAAATVQAAEEPATAAG